MFEILLSWHQASCRDAEEITFESAVQFLRHRSAVMRRVAVVVPMLLFCPLLNASEGSPTVSGTILDLKARPVVDAVVCSQWGQSKSGGAITPLGPHAKTDAAGHFSLSGSSVQADHLAFMVYDNAGMDGALVDLDLRNSTEPLTVTLHPAQRIHYTISAPSPIDRNDSSGELYTRSGIPIASLIGETGSLMLPSGDYELQASTPDTTVGKQALSVGDREVNLPTLVLEPSPMARHYGHGTPRMSMLRDMNHRPFEIGSLRGHWTLIYFWANWCVPCVQEGIPKLVAFVQTHGASAEEFRIVGVHENSVNEDGNWDVFREKTLKLEREVWRTEVVPFPLVYDETTHMTSDWGVHQFPTFGLIDPNGDLVRGGNLSTLEANLKTPRRHQ